MHGQHLVLDGEQVVHDGEDGLLDLAGVLGAGHDHDALGEVHEHGGLGVQALDRGVALVAGGGEDGEIGFAVGGALLIGGADEELRDEQGLAGALAGDHELAGVGAVGAGEAAHDVEVALTEVCRNAVADLLVAFLGDGNVHVAPGDGFVHVGGVHHEAVLGAATGVFAGFDHEGAVGRELALMMGECLLDELGGDHVEVDGVCAGMDAVALQNLGDGISSHCDPPQDGVRYRFLGALERCGGLPCRPGSARACQSASRKTFYHCIEVLVPHLRGGSCVVFGKGHASFGGR
ncbi:Uncharacterised protein [Collinsella intestinalis]|nr:Uncharacterised protein [Collinsella intestinalis]